MALDERGGSESTSSNLELKARCADLAAARRLARELATEWVGLDHQVGSYFTTRTGRSKLREIALYEKVRIHLDRVRGLGDFVELEAVYDGSAAVAISYGGLLGAR